MISESGKAPRRLLATPENSWATFSVKTTEQVACDTGPIVALVNRNDSYHEACIKAAEDLRYPLFTVWPVIVEAYDIIDRLGGPADLVLHWLVRRHVRIMDVRDNDVLRMRQLLK